MDTAIVTGASSGIGLSISKELLNLGYKVYGLGRDFSKSNLDNNNFIKLESNLMDINSLVTKINEIKKSNDIKILVNNAGVGYFSPHEELNPKKIHEMVTINLEVPLVLSQILLRTLKKNKGYIINISSIEAKKSSAHGCAYGATKAALSHFSSSLFDETRKYGVKVITIHPDITKSNFYRNSNFKEGANDDSFLMPEEIASAVAMAISQRDNLVITDITIRPQKFNIQRK
ncbi:SDR family oxidoreductase [Clostridium sp. HCP1S3_B4]|uniref:SDR family oxidoreductase n=1 Tax=unclassified Clostridium TaxID=2614128 RepID=UPI0016928361|nr:SDR family NAD(P)-dependent oxidoreductase [Clostridiales bacterium]MDY2730551.1 SDR family oxidoreductase [Clostridium sp.]NLK24337.1 SDR family oxidoreductase [Clostridiales bacterium]